MKLVNSRWLVLLVTVGLLLAFLTVPQAWNRRTSPARAQSSAALYLPIVLKDFNAGWQSPVGITMYGSVNDATGLTKIQKAGARWVVTILSWSTVEPQRGQRNWTTFDEKVRNARAAGMQVFVLFHDNPPWAAPYPDGPVTDTQDLVNFLTAAVERYNGNGVDDAPGSPRVAVWSFYAEPDSGDPIRHPWKGHWGQQPDRYAQMLALAANIVHQKDPQALVTNGGLAYDWFQEDGGPFVRTFLTDTLQTLNGMGGARQYLDAVSVHFYPISGFRWPTIREKVQEIRAIMARHGIGDLPIMVPEMGYWSDSVPHAPSLNSNEEQHARRLVQMFVRGWAEGVPLMAWHSVFDNGSGTEAHGLFHDSDLSRPKLAYTAYRTLTQELAQAEFLRSLTTSGVEGYVFRVPGGVEKTVVWGTGESSVGMDFPYACLRLVTFKGEEFQPILDGDSNWDWDGQANGRVRLGIYPGVPFYVAPCQ